jgi:hypothetical protein
LAASELLAVVLGCAFHNQPKFLAPTETEKITAAEIAKLATSREATGRMDFLGFPLLRVVIIRRK